ncbi:MAG: isocitrate lyase/phosphoenolpyruvate mutase family protein [Synergistaceae bacterium]
MIPNRQKQLAQKFNDMHKQKGIIILPNAWDTGSAVIFEKEGFQAVATTSAGVAYSLGYPDGEYIKIDDLILTTKQIAKRIDIPLSIDFESGYSDDIKEIKENAKKLIKAGACGFNIEDGKKDGTLDTTEHMIEKINALKELKKELDINFVINARTCTYWLNIGNEKEKLKTATQRGNIFAKAGADCVFVPGAMDKETVTQLTQNINSPLNIILNPTYHYIKEMETIGVKRISVGSGMARLIQNNTIETAKKLKENNVDDILSHKLTYAKANEYFALHDTNDK